MAVLVARRDGLHVGAHPPRGDGAQTRRWNAASPRAAPSTAACSPSAGRAQLRRRPRGARRWLCGGGCRARVACPLPGRPDRLRPARVRDRAVPDGQPVVDGRRSAPGSRWRGIRACRAAPRMRTPTCAGADGPELVTTTGAWPVAEDGRPAATRRARGGADRGASSCSPTPACPASGSPRRVRSGSPTAPTSGWRSRRSRVRRCSPR